MTTIPSPAELKTFIETFTERGDGAPTRRDIARAFGLKGPDRAALRHMLNDMEEDGQIALDGKRARSRDKLPPVMVMDVREVDEGGDLICTAVSPPDGVHIPPLLLPSKAAARTKPALGVGSRFLGRLGEDEGGHVVVDPLKVLGKGAPRVLGIFKKDRRGGRIEPVNRKQRDSYRVDPADIGEAGDGDLVWVETKPARGYGPKPARVVEVIGDISESRNWSLVALAEQDIPVAFPPAIVEAANEAVMPDDKHYEDLRELPLITIDPATAKDHDDAVYAEFDDDGFTVYVAIADVSWFVRPDTPLDAEARARGNSVYLVDRVVPMLPEVLSNGLCSLKAHEDRPALICEMNFTADGRKLGHKFRRAMMNSKAGISYEEAQAAANGKPNDRTKPITETIIKPLFLAFEKMTDAKAQAPSLDLDLPEREILLGKDGQVASVKAKERIDAHKLIETMMVAANVCAAETLEQARRTLIYRVHEPPNDERLEGLRDYLESQKYSLPKGQVLTPLAFNRILSKAAERDEIELISMAILRAQSQAIYSTKNLGHFGLNLSRYAHFTSPIRRYADLTVHRGLVAALKLGPGGNTAKQDDELEAIAEAISITERRAIAAERSTQDRFLAAFLEPQIGATFAGRVNGMAGAGLFVTLDETGADGFIPAKSLEGDYYVHDEERMAMVGRRTRKGYKMGQRVEVVLLEVTPVQGGLRFDMLSEPVPMEDRGGKPGGKRSGKKIQRRGSAQKPGRAPKARGPAKKAATGKKPGAKSKASAPPASPRKPKSPSPAKPAESGAKLKRKPKKKK